VVNADSIVKQQQDNPVIASAAKQSMARREESWIASLRSQ
jgi:hypothetical protein